MKKYLVLFLFAIITTVAFGQSNYQDVVYLKNGSIIRGVIIEQIPNKSIKIETADRNIFVYQMDEIEKLTKELRQGKGGSSLDNSGLQSGYKGIVESGYLVGVGYYGMDRFKLNIINGYQINPYFSLGFGTGLRYYYYLDATTTAIPVFADFRVNFLDRKFSPYLSLGVGYSFRLTGGFEGLGMLFSPTVGFSVKISRRNALNVGFGYERQGMEFYSSYYSDSQNSSAIGFNVGISF